MSIRPIRGLRASLNVSSNGRRSGDLLHAAVARAIEPLESRSLLCAIIHQNPLTDAIAAATAPLIGSSSATSSDASSFQAAAAAAGPGTDPATAPTAANGLPLIDTRPDAAAAIYLDFQNGYWGGYSDDADFATFNAEEQTTIANIAIGVQQYFSMFNLSVTTYWQSKPKAWVALSSFFNGGQARVDMFPMEQAEAQIGMPGGRDRISGIAHEVGHLFGLWHQAAYDNNGVKTAEYVSDGYIMGYDAAPGAKWDIGLGSLGPWQVQDDVAIIAERIRWYTGTDGFYRDDFANSFDSAATLSLSGGSTSTSGIIERLNDADVFSFSTTGASGGRYAVSVSPLGKSYVDLNLEVYDSSGKLVASNDGSAFNASVTPLMGGGTYYVRVASHGGAGDLGQYSLSISESAATVPAPSTGGPTGVAAMPLANTTNIRVTWSNVTGNLGYAVEESPNGYSWTQAATVGANVTNWTATNRAGGTRYFYRVRTIGLSGVNVLPYSAPVHAVTLPAAPVIAQTMYANTPNPSFIWRNSAGNAGYKILRSRDNVTFTEVGRVGRNWIHYGDGGLQVGTYHYRIVPLSASGDGVPATTTVTAPLSTPVLNAVADQTTSSLRVSWNGVPNAVGYKVYRSLDGATGWSERASVNGTTTSFTDTGLAALTNYHYYVQAIASVAAQNSAPSATRGGSTLAGAELPDGWSQTDIGPVRGAGASGFAGGVFTINASGYDIFGTVDSGRLTYRVLVGNVTLVARIDSITANDNAAKAGLWIRQGLGAGDKSIALTLNKGAFGIDFRDRSQSGGGSGYQNFKGDATAPYWLKLERVGDTFNGYISSDGVNYTLGGSRTIIMEGPVYAGLGVTASSDANMASAKFSNVSIDFREVKPPRFAQSPAADPSIVSGTTVNLSALGADEDGPESDLTYTWTPSSDSPAPVVFSANNSNAAKLTTVTFRKAGLYTFTVKVVDRDGFSATASVTVRVDQTLSGIATGASRMAAGTAQLVFPADQFGMPIAGLDGFTWSADIGDIDANGQFRAPDKASGAATVTGRKGDYVATTVIDIVNAAAWYRADEATGSTTLADASGSGRNATLVGSYGFGAGKTGNALDLTGGHASLPSGIVSSLTDFTIAAWVNLDSKPTWSRIFDFGTGTNNYMFLTAAAGNANTLRFAIRTPTTAEQVVNAPSFATGEWAHVAVTLVGETATIYVNGVAVGTGSGIKLNPSLLGQTTANYLGKAQFNDPAFDGRIDDFRIYSAGLPSAAVRQIYEAWQLPQAIVPDAPRDLAALVSANGVTLTWTDRANNEAGYRVERSSDGGNTFGAIATLAADSTQCVDAAVTSGTSYVYRVVGYNDVGPSDYSNIVQAITAPAAPTGLQADAGDARVTLSWQGSAGASGYEIRRSTAANGTYDLLAQVDGAASTSFVDEDVVNGTTYYYVVVAINGGGASEASAVAVAMPQVPLPLDPTDLSVVHTGSHEAELTWTDQADNEEGYQVERSDDGGQTFSRITSAPLAAGSTHFIDRGLTAGASYLYRVFAYNAGGESSRSNVAAATTLPDVSIVNVTSSSERPGIGDTVVLGATVTNRGAAALQDVAVRFYDGDPSNGGTLIGSVTLATLAAGASTSVTINWTPSTSGDRVVHAVVDPTNTLGDTSQADNQATHAQTVYRYFSYTSTARLVGTGTEGGRDVHKWYAFDIGVPMDFIAQLRVIAGISQYEVPGSTAANNRLPYLQSYLGDGINDRQQIGEVQPNGVGNWAMSTTNALVMAGIMPLMTNYIDLWIKDLDGSGLTRDQVKVDTMTVEIKYLAR